MARQVHTPIDGTGKYPVLASINELTWLPADVAEHESVPHEGSLVILARNVSEDTAADVTITSVASARTGRTGTLVFELAFGEQIIIGPLGVDGWRQSDG